MADTSINQHQQELESKLWAMANSLRGSMEAYEFKNYILGMIFYYYLSKREEDYMVNLLKDDGITFAEAWESDDYKEAVIEDNDLQGTLEPIEAAGKYVLAQPEGKDVCFYEATTGTIAAGKAYLEYEGAAGIKAFYFNFDGDPTGIANVEKVVENGAIYNVAGQRLNKMQRGINIVNGKKILK